MKNFLTLIGLFFTFGLLAQPINDDCDGVINLGVAPYCDPATIYDNVDATSSDIGFGNIPTCFNGGNVGNDVWFSFTANDTIENYIISIFGTEDGTNESITNPQIALYRGSCQVDGLSELACVSADPGETTAELSILGLLGGTTYFIRISDYSGSAAENWGDFTLCVDEEPPITTIDQGGSTLCSGQLSDSGGPDGDYSANEDFTFVICPSQPHQCINFNLSYYNVEYEGFDQLVFYDGDEVNPSNIITTIGGEDPFFFDSGEGGGGVCYPTIHATSGCMTIQFTSDGTVEMEGFEGSWECTNEPCVIPPPVVVEAGVTASEIADALTTPQSTVAITDINCPNSAYGKFTVGDNSDLGLGKGLLLTSGNIDWAPGPNDDPGGGQIDGDNQASGDADLDSLSIHYGDQALSNDACVIEMDVFVATDELRFKYIFGSEEYPEFTNPFNDPDGSQFNDIFAFLISGPGVVGDPVIGGQRNMAVLPDGNNTFVEINSVNNAVNWQYYRDNQLGQSVQYDGLTSGFNGEEKYLTAIQEVIPCNTYHLKMAIADRGDFIYDSGVFVSEIKGTTPNLAIEFTSGLDYFTEGCSSSVDSLVIELTSTSDEPISYNVIIGGTAELGVDYLINIPAAIEFAPGEDRLTFPITILSDLLTEGTENIEFSLSNDFGCGEVELTTISVDLLDELNVEIETPQDTIFVCDMTSLQVEATGAVDYTWTPGDLFDNPNISNPTMTTIQEGWVEVLGEAGGCSDKDSIYIVPVTVEATPNEAFLCEGESVDLSATLGTTTGVSFQWEPEIGTLPDSSALNITVTPASSSYYYATVTGGLCRVIDTVLVTVDSLPNLSIIADPEKDPYCQGDLITFSSPTYESYFFPNITHQWFGPGMESPDSLFNLVITAQDTFTYFRVTQNNACIDTSYITINVMKPIPMSIAPAQSTICAGQTVDLVLTYEGDGNLSWSSTPEGATFSCDDCKTPTVSVGQSSIIMVQDDNQCPSSASATIEVVSSPFISLPGNLTFCAGDVDSVLLYAPPYFDGYSYQWSSPDDASVNSTDPGLIVAPQMTTTYVLTATNACGSAEAERTLIIIDEEPSVVVDDIIICVGFPGILHAMTDASEPSVEIFDWEIDGQHFDGNNAEINGISDNASGVLHYSYGDCYNVDVPFNIVVIQEFEATLTSNVPSVIAGGTVELTATTNPANLSDPTYTWSLGNVVLGETTVPTFTATVLEGGSGTQFTVTVTTAEGCTATATVDIEIINVEIPNVFTPNGDGSNDSFMAFYPEGAGVTVSKLIIYNRWGQVVHEADGNIPWTGTFKSKPAASDVYLYHITFDLGGGKTMERSGELTLLR